MPFAIHRSCSEGLADSLKESAMAKKKTKSMISQDGERKLAAGGGREKSKSGGEAKKKSDAPKDASRRPGSSK
jgi:hypothetical protein